MRKLLMNTSLPIGIFDSGVGGLTVYRALHEHLFVLRVEILSVPWVSSESGRGQR